MDRDLEGMKEELLRDIDGVMDILSRQKIRVKGLKDVELFDFVDGEGEARAILEGTAGIRLPLSHDLIILYGPKGCGKTEIFKTILASIKRANEIRRTVFEAIYKSYERSEKAKRAVKAIGSGSLLSDIGDDLKKLEPSITITPEGLL